MAHPKRRQSKTRTLKRRTHDIQWLLRLAVCPNWPVVLCLPHSLPNLWLQRQGRYVKEVAGIMVKLMLL